MYNIEAILILNVNYPQHLVPDRGFDFPGQHHRGKESFGRVPDHWRLDHQTVTLAHDPDALEDQGNPVEIQADDRERDKPALTFDELDSHQVDCDGERRGITGWHRPGCIYIQRLPGPGRRDRAAP